MSHGQKYYEDGELVQWFKNFCYRNELNPYEELQRMIDEGETELFGHRCWNCGRTWSDGEDDHVNECYEGDGCNARY